MRVALRVLSRSGRIAQIGSGQLPTWIAARDLPHCPTCAGYDELLKAGTVGSVCAGWELADSRIVSNSRLLRCGSIFRAPAMIQQL